MIKIKEIEGIFIDKEKKKIWLNEFNKIIDIPKIKEIS